MNKDFPIRECKSCGFKTISTSTIDWCPKCKDDDGLRPRHFLTRDKDLPISKEEPKR